MEEIEKVIRNFENTEYFGYIFYIEYDGKKFSSFDENPNEKSIKSEFRKLLEKNGIKIFKGIQQAGRTDKDVSAKENMLYINSKHHIEFEEIEHKEIDGLKILKIEKTLPFLGFPELIEKRHYIYEYPEKLIKNTEEKQAGKELYRILDENFGIEEMGIAAKKGNKKLIEEIEKAIDELRKDGTYEKIYSKWFKD